MLRMERHHETCFIFILSSNLYHGIRLPLRDGIQLGHFVVACRMCGRSLACLHCCHTWRATLGACLGMMTEDERLVRVAGRLGACATPTTLRSDSGGRAGLIRKVSVSGLPFQVAFTDSRSPLQRSRLRREVSVRVACSLSKSEHFLQPQSPKRRRDLPL